MSPRKIRLSILLILLILTTVGGSIVSQHARVAPRNVMVNKGPEPVVQEKAGTILSRTKPELFSLAQVQSQSHFDYGYYTIAAKYEVEKTVISYRSYDVDGTPIVVYARIYTPVGVTRAPVFAFAPGTTGVGDVCAASLEVPSKASWANYEAHMLTYAGQGYATVITDYEGMRDPSRLHHYMIGALEGRAVLDSVRALIHLDSKGDALDAGNIYLAGYSQGGHSVLWANQIAASYAPELKLRGIIGFGAVVNVDETLQDVTHGSDLSWFGPYVLTSYADYYKELYPLDQILLPKFRTNLVSDVTSHCIDTDLAFWGKDPNNVFTAQFVTAMKMNAITAISPQLAMRMQQNNIGPLTARTPILLNGGIQDNVVLPSQQSNALVTFCRNQVAPVHLREYLGINHYNTMAASLKDVLFWMDTLRAGKAVPTDCATT